MNGWIRASNLDALEYYYCNEYDPNNTVEKFVASITETEPETKATKHGTKFHKLIDEASKDTIPGIVIRDMSRDFETSQEIKLLRPQSSEFRAYRTLRFGDDEVTFTGKADAIHGRTIIDYKTTAASTIDLEKYMFAYQWRAYLFLNERADRFRYEVFRFNAGYSKILDHDYIEMRRYDGMEDEVVEAIRQYWRFVKRLHNEGWIEIRPNGPPLLGEKTKPKPVYSGLDIGSGTDGTYKWASDTAYIYGLQQQLLSQPNT